MLLPLPGQTMRSCAQELGATSKVIGAAMAQLLTAATQVNFWFFLVKSSMI